MKIQFCDLCNESVPQPDLDQGRAFYRKGRLICASCERSMSRSPFPDDGDSPMRLHSASEIPASYPHPFAAPHSEPRATGFSALPATLTADSPPAPASAPQRTATDAPRSGGTWIAVLGLLFTTGAIFVVDDRLQANSEAQGNIDKQLEKVEKDVLQVGRQREEALAREAALEERMAARLRSEQAARGDLTTTVAEVRTQVEAESRESARISKSLSELAARPTGLDPESARTIADLSARLAKSEDERHGLVARLSALEKAGVPAPVPVAEESKPIAPAWQGLVADLKSADEGVRLETVYALGETKDPAILSYLQPLLKDSSVFVRMAVARFLGEFNARAAIGDLIDALEDEQSAVRETAFLSLRAITGKDLKFDPNAGEGERQKRVKAWRDWYAKEREGKSATD